MSGFCNTIMMRVHPPKKSNESEVEKNAINIETVVITMNVANIK